MHTNSFKEMGTYACRFRARVMAKALVMMYIHTLSGGRVSLMYG